jgi:diguanylate cyclase (GGDEF)-like protein
MRTESQPLILIVDDVPANIQVLAEMLRKEYRIKFATSGVAALELASREDQPDLILLDVMMAGMDGYEVCRRLKEQPSTRGIPIIFVTARDDAPDEQRGLDLGAVDYIGKPFQIPVVKARIRNHLNLKRKTDLLESLALLDGLTNIPNRRSFDDALDREWRRACRGNEPLSVVMADIDFFKKYNDQYGHGAGDNCLKVVAEALKGSLIRPADGVFRYGGEEFAAILPATDFKGAASVTEHFRQAVESLGIAHAQSTAADHVTLSVGFAAAHPSGPENIAAVLEAADKMLYQAKSSGRNCVCGIELH